MAHFFISLIRKDINKFTKSSSGNRQSSRGACRQNININMESIAKISDTYRNSFHRKKHKFPIKIMKTIP